MASIHAFGLRALIGAAALAAVAACSSTPEETYTERPVEDLYSEALDSLQERDYRAAQASFEEVERQHPYSVWANKAQLMSAYTLYEQTEYDEAVIALDRYIQLHPGSRDAVYAYYLKALCYYEQISDVGRDQEMTERALEALQDVVTRFPDSEYARDAQLKIDLAHDHLAGKEMEIGRFYLSRGEYPAAINRFRRVLEDYQTTTHVPEALHRLAEAYTALGVEDEAEKVAAVLGYNYPGSDWYIDSYELVEQVDVPGNEATDETLLESWVNSLF